MSVERQEHLNQVERGSDHRCPHRFWSWSSPVLIQTAQFLFLLIAYLLYGKLLFVFAFHFFNFATLKVYLFQSSFQGR